MSSNYHWVESYKWRQIEQDGIVLAKKGALHTKHTLTCCKKQFEYKFKEIKFAHKHPNYCRRCRGKGIVSDNYDPSPAGLHMPSGYLTDDMLCPHCTDFGISDTSICPQCANRMVWEKDKSGAETGLAHCKKCDYKLDANEYTAEGYELAPDPEIAECYCWEIELGEIEESYA